MSTAAAILPPLSLLSRARVIRAATFTPGLTAESMTWGLPLLWWGNPGASKSSFHRTVLRWCGLAELFVGLNPGERGQGATAAIPTPLVDEEGRWLAFPYPEWARALVRSGRGVILCDDFLTGDSEVQKALWALFLDRRLGGNYLGGGVRVFAASNPEPMIPDAPELSLPHANRMIHMNYPSPSVAEIEAYFTGLAHGPAPAPEGFVTGVATDCAPGDVDAVERAVLAAWPDALRRAAARVVAFLRANPTRAEVIPAPGEGLRGFPTARSWEFAVRVLASAEVHALTDEERLHLLAGCVGLPVAIETDTFLRDLDLPDPEDLVFGRVTLDWEHARTDRANAAAWAVSGYLRGLPAGTPTTNAAMREGWRLFVTIAEARADVAMAPAKALVEGGRHGGAAYARDLMRVAALCNLKGVSIKAGD